MLYHENRKHKHVSEQRKGEENMFPFIIIIIIIMVIDLKAIDEVVNLCIIHPYNDSISPIPIMLSEIAIHTPCQDGARKFNV